VTLNKQSRHQLHTKSLPSEHTKKSIRVVVTVTKMVTLLPLLSPLNSSFQCFLLSKMEKWFESSVGFAWDIHNYSSEVVGYGGLGSIISSFIDRKTCVQLWRRKVGRSLTSLDQLIHHKRHRHQEQDLPWMAATKKDTAMQRVMLTAMMMTMRVLLLETTILRAGVISFRRRACHPTMTVLTVNRVVCQSIAIKRSPSCIESF
jgi:hypothetical protein